jgi:hypothetical protein
MAYKTNPSRKKPVSSKRVALVLASLVGTMTISALTLLLMEGGAMGTSTVPEAWLAGKAVAAAPVPAAAGLPKPSWNYIIIYESGEEAASAATLTDGRVTGGSNSAKAAETQSFFHFVIDSAHGSYPTSDGELKVGASWKNQLSGAPSANWPDARSYLYPYTNAIGVCFIGNVSRKPVSERQHAALLQVVRDLQRMYNIPAERVMFQWDAGLKAKSASAAHRAYDQKFRSDL